MNDLRALLARRINDIQLSNQISQWRDCEKKEFPDVLYMNYKSVGISLCFTKSDQTVNSIFVYNGGVDGFSKYEGDLPYSLSLNMTNADVVRLLGEPDGKPPRGNVIPIFIDYKSLGLQIDFKTKSYSDNKNPITNICLYLV